MQGFIPFMQSLPLDYGTRDFEGVGVLGKPHSGRKQGLAFFRFLLRSRRCRTVQVQAGVVDQTVVKGAAFSAFHGDFVVFPAFFVLFPNIATDNLYEIAREIISYTHLRQRAAKNIGKGRDQRGAVLAVYKNFPPRGQESVQVKAQGLGRQIIRCCKDEWYYEKDENGNDKNSLHFDVKHYNIILWKSHEDLIDRLKANIRLNIPGAIMSDGGDE